MIFKKFIIYVMIIVFYFYGEASAKEYCRLGDSVAVLECHVPIIIDGKKLEVDARYLPGMPLYTFPPSDGHEMILVGYSKYFLPRDDNNKDDFYPFSLGNIVTVSVEGWGKYNVSEMLTLEEFKRINRFSLMEYIGSEEYNGIYYEKYKGGKGNVAFFYNKKTYDICYNMFSEFVDYCVSFFDLDGFRFKARYNLNMIESKRIFIEEFLRKWSEFRVDEFSSR